MEYDIHNICVCLYYVTLLSGECDGHLLILTLSVTVVTALDHNLKFQF